MTSNQGNEAFDQPGISTEELTRIKQLEEIRLLVISDTHNVKSAAVRALNKAPATDLILHLGDHVGDYKELRDRLDKPLIAVRGNCDEGTNSFLPDRKILALSGYNILMLHGHNRQIDVKKSLLMLKKYVIKCETRIDLVLFGHTHLAYDETIDLTDRQIRFLNPGSCGFSLDNHNHALEIILSSNLIQLNKIV